MSTRVNFRRNNRKRRRRNKRYNRYPRIGTATSLSVLAPDRMRVKLMYSDTVIQSGLGGALSEQTYRGNSLFDPDKTGVGLQPVGHDQWSNFYGKYRVLSSSIKCQFVPPTSGLTAFVNACVLPTTADPSGFTSFNAARCNPYAKYKITTGTQANGHTDINNHMSVGKFFGLDIRSNDGTSAQNNNNPAQEMFWQIICGPGLGGTADHTINVVTTITYYCEYYDRSPLNLS